MKTDDAQPASPAALLCPQCGYDVSVSLDAGRRICPECSAGLRREECLDGAAFQGLRSRAALHLGLCALVGLVAGLLVAAGRYAVTTHLTGALQAVFYVAPYAAFFGAYLLEWRLRSRFFEREGLVATSEFCAGPRRRIEALGFLATLGGCLAGVLVGIVVPALVP